MDKRSAKRTTMPRARQSPIRSYDAVFQRCSIMCAFGAHGMSPISHLDKQNLSILNSVHFNLAFFPILKVTLGKASDFVFLYHDFSRSTERR